MGPNRIWSEAKRLLARGYQPTPFTRSRGYGRVQRFLRQPNCQKRLLAEAALTLVGVKVMLLAVPFERWRHLLDNSPEGNAAPINVESVKNIAAAVSQLSRRSLVALSCLPQAIAVRSMMHRRGLYGALRVGVARARDGGIRAHAWVVYNGEVIIGGLPDLDQFTILSSIDPALSSALRH